MRSRLIGASQCKEFVKELNSALKSLKDEGATITNVEFSTSFNSHDFLYHSALIIYSEKFEISGEYMDDEIANSQLSTRVRNACAFSGIITWRDLVEYGLKNLYKHRNVGKRTIDEIKREMRILGMGRFIKK